MKILLLSHNFKPFIGGIEVMSEMLCEGFAKAGHEVRVLTWTTGPDQPDLAYKVIRMPNRSMLLRQHHWADLIFENNPSLKLSWPRLFIKRPSVVVLHTWVSRTDGSIAIQDRLKKGWLSMATKVVAVSQSLRQGSFLAASVIGNPYRSSLFRLMPEVRRDKEFVFLGRLVQDKGVIMAIWALYHIIGHWRMNDPQGPVPQLTIIGEGPEQPILQAEAHKLGIENHIRFMGALEGDRLVACMNEHRYQLVPSIWKEPFGIAALEGIACGCIPFVANGGGLPDAVGSAGEVFERGNLTALVSSIKTLKSDPSREAELLAGASAHLAQFKPEQIMNQYLNIVENIHQGKLSSL